jgi:hypothetical protein
MLHLTCAHFTTLSPHIHKLFLFLLNHVVSHRQSHVFKLIDMEHLEPTIEVGGGTVVQRIKKL